MYNHVLNVVAASLVSNGVNRKVINEALQKVVDEERDHAIARATQRANDRAVKLIATLDDNIGYEIAVRNNDYQKFVDRNAHIDENNNDSESIRLVDSVAVVTNFGRHSGVIEDRYYYLADPLVYEGQSYWGHKASQIVRQHNSEIV